MSDITRITAEHYHASREDATGRVELTISGEEGAVVIDLGDDGDEILVGLLDLEERDEEAGPTMSDPMTMEELEAFRESAPERVGGPLWSLLDWSFWGAGMGDVFREPLANVMLAAIPDNVRDQAEAIMADFIERRSIEKTGVTVYQEQRAEVERLKARLEAAEGVMWLALAQPDHEAASHLLALYLGARDAAQAQQDGGQADG
jgi:hypothetical protein